MSKPKLVEQAEDLRAAFQAGSDERMMQILVGDGMLAELINAITRASDRTLTYASPYISDLAKRVGYLAAEERQ